MPEITMTFSLPEEQSEFDHAILGTEWYLAVNEIVNELRTRLKYENAGKEIDEFNEWVWGVLNERGLDPYKE
jgi:hypothetical protein